MNKAEQEKWNLYYKSLSAEEPAPLNDFSREFAGWVESLLPPGQRRCLEAGCGAGYQSAALAERTGFETHLLDFSQEALRCARALFEQRGLNGHFHSGDIHEFASEAPPFDLVFNVGVLEHYSFEEQAAMLRAMSRLSGGLVVAVVPNARCYWYWIARVRNAANGLWPFGVEIAATSLKQVFEAAGLEVAGERYFGLSLTNSFVSNLPEMDAELKSLLGAIHEQQLLPPDASHYLYAASGVKAGRRFTISASGYEADASRALAGDSIAAMLAMRSHQVALENQLQQWTLTGAGLQTQLAEARAECARVEAERHALLSEAEQLRQRCDELTAGLRETSAASSEFQAQLSAARLEHARAEAERDALRGELEQLRQGASGLAASLEQTQSELAGARSALQSETMLREFTTAGLALQLHRARTALSEAQRELKNQSDRLRTMEAELELRIAELAKLRTSLTSLANGVRSHRAAYNAALRDYSLQRTWRLMVTLRKVYAQWAASGPAGKLKALFLLLNPFAREGTYAEYEIALPASEAYITLPETIREAADSPLPALQESAPPVFQPLQRKYDVIILAIIDFDFRYQRPQQIAAHFAAAGHRVFWVSPTRFVSPDDPSPYHAHQLRENLWEIHLRGRQPDIYLGKLDPAACESFKSSLLELRKSCAIAEGAIMVQLPFWRQLAVALQRECSWTTCYDCMDDWDTFQNLGDFNRTEEVQLVKDADVVFVSAAKLQEKFEARGVTAHLVRNGVDYAFFNTPPAAAPPEQFQKPVIGYYGAIADWIDLDLVYQVASLRPEYSFVLIGQVFNRDMSQLESLPNVHLLGHKPYESLPSYLRLFDVCHIPFLLNEVTAATDPVKLYEYLSAGKPVVSTGLSELAFCRDLVLVANTAPEYAEAIDRALQLTSGDDVRRRREFARSHTWTLRVAAMDAVISGAMPLVSVIVVTRNCERYIDLCLASLRRNCSYANLEVLVIDNASTDNTYALLLKHAAVWNKIKLIRSEQNSGFAAANNAAIQQAQGEYLVLLNPDTVVTPGWCGRLLMHLTCHDDVGLVSAVTNFAGNEVKVNFDYDAEESMERFAVRRAELHQGEHTDVAVAPLFCSMVRKNLYDEIGGLDERFEIGMFEDDDFSLKVRERGLRVVAAEDCFVHHFGQGSFSQLSPAEYNELFAINRSRFEEKWDREWIPHQVRPGTKPPLEDRRFQPEAFAAAP